MVLAARIHSKECYWDGGGNVGKPYLDSKGLLPGSELEHDSNSTDGSIGTTASSLGGAT
jgi:hypothetical protein